MLPNLNSILLENINRTEKQVGKGLMHLKINDVIEHFLG